ncbi:MAG: TIGR03364 family FAD-dependent oxidoreductase [Fimbriiglobus sp.]
MSSDFDCAVVGGGIVGLAWAWLAAERGQKVVVFERDAKAQGATIRNFGMLWPIGQELGVNYNRAMRSRKRWLRLQQEAGLWLERCGSWHLAHHELESQILGEFAGLATEQGVEAEVVSAKDVLTRFPAANPEGLVSGLYSPTECVVEPREVPEKLAAHLAKKYGVVFEKNTTIHQIEMPELASTDGRRWRAKQVFVCSGVDFQTLFPNTYRETGLRTCKLQMVATGTQPAGWKLGGHVAGGLTLCHYKAFVNCPTLPEYRAYVKANYPDHVRFGIHVMASQNSEGHIVIGDSHEYDEDISIFWRADIDELILQYLKTLVRLPDWHLARSWAGFYAKHPTDIITYREPQPGCTVVAGVGGAGMTLSFGFAEDWWQARD